MEISKEELLEERLAYAEDALSRQAKTMHDLMEYLCRVDLNFQVDPRNFKDWRQRLEKLRAADQLQKEISQAKQMLCDHGYLVVANESELDAARVKQWVNTKIPPDDDVPF